MLKPGTDDRPLFITHGLGGDVTELCPLVEKVLTGHPIYGLQWKGLDGSEEPDRSVENMANYFMNAIVQLQPRGPYLFAGLSIGGLPMLELADRLLKRGEKVDLLLFLDTYPHPRYWPLGSWIGVLLKRFSYHFSAMRKIPCRNLAPHFVNLCSGFLQHLQLRRGAARGSARFISPSDPPSLQRLRKCALEALGNYHPRYYRGKISFLHAEGQTSFPKDPSKIWRKLASEFEIHNLPCNHQGLIGSHADIAARWLSLRLTEA
jgi:acetoacetyl-CoA synthetase